jgi:hypothetical protein
MATTNRRGMFRIRHRGRMTGDLRQASASRASAETPLRRHAPCRRALPALTEGPGPRPPPEQRAPKPPAAAKAGALGVSDPALRADEMVVDEHASSADRAAAEPWPPSRLSGARPRAAATEHRCGESHDQVRRTWPQCCAALRTEVSVLTRVWSARPHTPQLLRSPYGLRSAARTHRPVLQLGRGAPATQVLAHLRCGPVPLAIPANREHDLELADRVDAVSDEAFDLA